MVRVCKVGKGSYENSLEVSDKVFLLAILRLLTMWSLDKLAEETRNRSIKKACGWVELGSG